MNKNGMFKTECTGGCGRILYVYALNKRGDLPKVYCENKFCKSKSLNEKRMK
jgi:hypothetical protein